MQNFTREPLGQKVKNFFSQLACWQATRIALRLTWRCCISKVFCTVVLWFQTIILGLRIAGFKFRIRIHVPHYVVAGSVKPFMASLSLQTDQCDRGHRFCWLEIKTCVSRPCRRRLYIPHGTRNSHFEVNKNCFPDHDHFRHPVEF